MTSLDKSLQWLPPTYRIKALIPASAFKALYNLTSTDSPRATSHHLHLFLLPWSPFPPMAACCTPLLALPRTHSGPLQVLFRPPRTPFLPLQLFSVWKVPVYSTKPRSGVTMKPLISPEFCLLPVFHNMAITTHRTCEQICLFPCVHSPLDYMLKSSDHFLSIILFPLPRIGALKQNRSELKLPYSWLLVFFYSPTVLSPKWECLSNAGSRQAGALSVFFAFVSSGWKRAWHILSTQGIFVE